MHALIAAQGTEFLRSSRPEQRACAHIYHVSPVYMCSSLLESHQAHHARVSATNIARVSGGSHFDAANRTLAGCDPVWAVVCSTCNQPCHKTAQSHDAAFRGGDTSKRQESGSTAVDAAVRSSSKTLVAHADQVFHGRSLHCLHDLR